MSEHVGDRIEKLTAGKNEDHGTRHARTSGDESQCYAEAVAAERSGRTNTTRDMTAAPEQGPAPGRWDSVPKCQVSS